MLRKQYLRFNCTLRENEIMSFHRRLKSRRSISPRRPSFLGLLKNEFNSRAQGRVDFVIAAKNWLPSAGSFLVFGEKAGAKGGRVDFNCDLGQD